MRVSLITGITGQDGSYLAELLLDKGYEVWGIIRRSSDINTQRIDHIFDRLHLRYGDMTDGSNMFHILMEIKNRYGIDLERLEVYNLAAMSHVKVSFDMPEYVGDVDGIGTLRLLEAIRSTDMVSKTYFYQASTSELYGKVQEVPQTETTPFYPRSPYAVAKLYAYWIVKNYREAYGMNAYNGILFNHCSPRRGPTFVTRKVTRGLGMILRGEQDSLVLGNLDAKRDWGHAKDYVLGMYNMLNNAQPGDYVLSTGEYHSVREFVEKAFALRGFDIVWRGEGVNEVGYDKNSGRDLIFISSKYFRPTEVDELLGDSSKAKRDFGWEPKYSFDDLIKDMVDNDTPTSLHP